MAKKDKYTFQLLPLEYLLKIGRIRKSKHGQYYVSKDRMISIPTLMIEQWNRCIGVEIEMASSGTKDEYRSRFDFVKFQAWTVRKSWCKP